MTSHRNIIPNAGGAVDVINDARNISNQTLMLLSEARESIQAAISAQERAFRVADSVLDLVDAERLNRAVDASGEDSELTEVAFVVARLLEVIEGEVADFYAAMLSSDVGKNIEAADALTSRLATLTDHLQQAVNELVDSPEFDQAMR